MTTVVYANTDKPYEEWRPAYVIVGFYEKNTWRSHWIPWETYQRAKPEADRLVDSFWKTGRWGKVVTNTSRWKKEICEAMVLIINSGVEGIKAKVDYPPYEENHCRVFTLVRQ